MFTGIIDSIGHITNLDRRNDETRFTIAPQPAWQGYERGESIAVNGVCLTVETFASNWFTAYASAQTLAVTNLGTLRVSSAVNLERALALGDRLGGHLVSGHVDCLAKIVSSQPAGESRCYRISFDPAFGHQVIAKGSVALDGISLTINDCGPDYLEVNIIPTTQQETTISTWHPGQHVNMETDVIGKYVSRMLGPWMSAPAPNPSAITADFLKKYGF